ncbi:MAG: hypothetical protein CMJ51_04260 [Planctomycetaceae bacterium]|nr:hypothetical protein [Planctomycetaceae bacterium]
MGISRRGESGRISGQRGGWKNQRPFLALVRVGTETTALLNLALPAEAGEDDRMPTSAPSPSPPRANRLAGHAVVVTMMLLIGFGAAEPPTPLDPVPIPPTPETETPTSDEKEVTQAPQRVHLWVDRYEETSGEVVDEDEALLTIRNQAGTVRTFSKSRLMRIIRLTDLIEPCPGMVEMRDGTLLSGLLVKDGYDEVVLRIEGVNTRLPRESVVQTRLDLTTEQKYRRFREQIAPDQYLRRFELASWLFEEDSYELAREELIEIVRAIQLPQAIQLLRIVEAQIALENDTLPPARSIERPADSGDTGPVDLKDLLPKEILSEEDVNLIRVYEIDFRAPPARVHVSPQTIRDLLETHGSNSLIPGDSAGRTRLFRADPLEVVDLMFKLKAREFYPRIEVQSEPPALNLFRQRIHDGWLIPNCATSRCHGGLDAGRFFLHRRGSKSERVRYTNLLIVERWNELDQPLIDWENPGRSLLIQYALPRNEARFPHPDVKGWRPIFTRGNQRLLRESIRWIENMYRPRPGYPVEYEAPVIAPPSLPEPFSDETEAPDGRRGR